MTSSESQNPDAGPASEDPVPENDSARGNSGRRRRRPLALLAVSALVLACVPFVWMLASTGDQRHTAETVPDRPVAIHARAPEEAQAAARKLHAVGLLELAGYLDAPETPERLAPVDLDELERAVGPRVDGRAAP